MNNIYYKKIFKCDVNINVRTKIKPYELDIYISEYNIAFEYDGKLWHKKSEKYEFLNDFKRENPTHYAYIKRHKLWDLISHLKRLK